MATPDSIGTCNCGNCDHEVYVRKNRSGFAYYRCEYCGLAAQHHILRHSEFFIKSRVKLHAPEAGAPAAPAAVVPEKPAPAAPPKPAAKPAAKGGSLADLLGARS